MGAEKINGGYQSLRRLQRSADYEAGLDHLPKADHVQIGGRKPADGRKKVLLVLRKY